MKPVNLHNKKLDSGFKVPNTYFDDLEDAVFQKMNLNSEKPVKKLAFKKLWLYNSVAACALLAFGIAFYMKTTQTELDQNDLESYLMANTTSDDIYQNLSEQDIEELTENILNKQDVYEYVSIDLGYYSDLEND